MNTNDATQRERQYAVTLLRPLDMEPLAASRVDVARAVADGRRRRRSRWYASGAAVVALTATAVTGGPLAVAALNPPAPAPTPALTPTASATPSSTAGARPDGPTGCTVTRLPTDGIDKALVTGADSSGRYAVGRTYPGTAKFRYPLVVWKDGKLVDEVEMPGSDQSLNDVNSRGVAVGSSFDAKDRKHPYVYRDGTVSRLAGDGEGTATAINDAGVIIGGLGGDPLYPRPVRWASATAQPVALTVPKGVSSAAVVDIDEDGTILGMITRGRDKDSGYLWAPDGTGRELALPKVDGKAPTSFWPNSLRNGWIGGQAVIDTDKSRAFTAFRFRIDTGQYERLPVAAGRPLIAANGWIVNAMGPPILLGGGRIVTLPKYRKQTDYQVVSISDDGRVIVGYSSSGMQNHPLRWRCD